jgi:hypothetical protein
MREKKKWRPYEEVAQYLLEQFASYFDSAALRVSNWYQGRPGPVGKLKARASRLAAKASF